VAVGWSGYAAPLLAAWTGFPVELTQAPTLGGIINLPAIVIIAIVAGVLILGTRRAPRSTRCS
jgi:APA family basic amino acid/polyamine antiporter